MKGSCDSIFKGSVLAPFWGLCIMMMASFSKCGDAEYLLYLRKEAIYSSHIVKTSCLTTPVFSIFEDKFETLVKIRNTTFGINRAFKNPQKPLDLCSISTTN